MDNPVARSSSAAPQTGIDNRVRSEIERIFHLQRAHRQVLARTTARERITRLKRLRATVLEHRQDIQTALYRDFQKPPEETDLTEILPLSLEIQYAVRHLKRWMRPRKVRTPLVLFGTKSEVRYEPKGCGLIIAPWNYPFLLTLGPLVGAVAAGCTATLKPSEFTSHTSRLMKELVAEAFDEREAAVVEGDHHVAQVLLSLPYDHIYFTGSPRVGKIVMRAAAEHLASVTLELGGKSPAIVDETADVEEAARKIAYGKFTNGGQTCIAPDYLYVHEKLHDEFVAALRRRIKAMYGATDTDRAASSALAHIIDTRHHSRLQKLHDEAVRSGARAVVGGGSDPETLFFDATLLTNLPDGTSIMEEEIFGPLFPILSFSSLEEVLDAVNGRPRPLALYIFSRSRANIVRILGSTSAGGTCINDTLLHFANPELPFGGIGQSGMGKGYGYYGFLAFSNERAVLRQRLKRSPLQMLYPPYSDTKRKLIDWMLKYL